MNGITPTNLTYDDEDRLKTINGLFGSHTYTYNGFDTRVGKNGTSYHRDGAGVTAPLLSDDQATYTPGISERRAGVTTFSHGGLKDGSAQTDNSQNITATKQYDAYGQVLTGTGIWKGPFGYGGQAGYQTDESGLQLLGHRYYDSSTGRFITRDPIKDGRNWYAYCDNNPVSRIDPNGLQASSTCPAIGYGLMLRIMQMPPWLRDRILAVLGYSLHQANQLLNRTPQASRLVAEAADDAADFVAKRGGAAHRATVEAAQRVFSAIGQHTSGGTKAEEIVRTGGVKDRFPDLTFDVDLGQRIAIQIGRQLKNGMPVARERAAIADLIKSGKFDEVIFIPYNIHFPMTR